MRVGVVAAPCLPIPPVKYGGTEQVIYHLITGLKEMGHEPILLGTADSTIDCEIIPIAKTHLFFPRTSSEVPAYEAALKRINKVIAHKLRELLPRIDIIHSHGFDMWGFRDFPNLTTLHNPFEFGQIGYYVKRKALPYISISHNQQKSFPSLNYVANVYNGEDPNKFPFVAKPKNYVCFLGRFDRDKNPHLAIQLALAAKIKIKLAGKIDFKGEEYFKKEIEPYFKHPLVEYLGELGFEEKIKLLSNAKCNLHPTTFREPFGLNVLEAAYCGTPTLAIARGALPELIKDSKTGILVEDFMEGFHRLEECFKLDRAIVARSFREKFNYKIMSEQYVAAYEKVLADMSSK